MGFTRKDLGHGIGLRPKHYGRFLAEAPSVDWVEAISENFLAPGGRPYAVLEKVRREVPVVLHGVSLAIGSVDPLDERLLRGVRELADRVEPAYVSDHLCWGRHSGRYVHDLLPLPYTEEALAHVVSRVRQVQEALGRQILLENVYVSARNHGFDPDAYLAGIPVDRVGQFHLAGHSDHGRYVLDSHDAPVVDAVWELYRSALRRFGRVPALIEWDDHVPELERLLEESGRAREVEAEVLG